MPTHEGASTLRAGDPHSVPEQEQDAGAGAARSREERAAGEGVREEGPAGAKGEGIDFPFDRRFFIAVGFFSFESADARREPAVHRGEGREDQDPAREAGEGAGGVRRGIRSAGI